MGQRCRVGRHDPEATQAVIDEVPELLRFDATTMASMVRNGEISSSELVTAHLEHLAQINPVIHGMVQISEHAIDAANEADRVLRRGDSTGPLHGVPFTVKDWIESNDLICSAGFKARADHVPEKDATAVARMRAAGGVLIGKTKAGSLDDLYPIALNPHNHRHTSGASSSGEAATISAGGSPVGLGSDSGGSLRWPAHCCGVSTLKPSSGVVPLTGHYPSIIALSDPRTVIGPIARSVRDLRLALQIIAGEDGYDASALPKECLHKVSEGPIRVAFFTEIADVKADAATIKAVEVAVEILKGLGAVVTEAVPPRIEEAFAITRAYWSRPESGSLDAWQPWGKSSLAADEIERSLFEWDRLRRAFLNFMQNHDVIICPVGATAAPDRLEVDWHDYQFTVPFSLTGYPSVVVPITNSDKGLPIGVQVVARNFHDLNALQTAESISACLAK